MYCSKRIDQIDGGKRFSYAKVINGEAQSLATFGQEEAIKGIDCYSLNYSVNEKYRGHGLAVEAVCKGIEDLKKEFIQYMDFVSDGLGASGRRFRILTVVDDFTRQCVLMYVDFSIPGATVTRELSKLKSLPKIFNIDNGSEFTSRALDQWAFEKEIKLDCRISVICTRRFPDCVPPLNS